MKNGGTAKRPKPMPSRDDRVVHLVHPSSPNNERVFQMRFARNRSTGTAMFLAIVLLSCFLTSTLFAQRMGMNPEERANRLKEQLSLTKTQTDSVKKIFEHAQQVMMEEMMVNQGDREAMRKVFTEITEKTDKEIEKLLDAKQKKKYEEIKKERQAMMRERQQQRQQ